jgi:hypothetical protein
VLSLVLKREQYIGLFGAFTWAVLSCPYGLFVVGCYLVNQLLLIVIFLIPFKYIFVVTVTIYPGLV